MMLFVGIFSSLGSVHAPSLADAAGFGRFQKKKKYRCTGRFRSSPIKVITCRKKPGLCKTGRTTWHPTCYRHCWMNKRIFQRKCQREKGSEWRLCVQNSKAPNTRTRKLNCKQKFQTIWKPGCKTKMAALKIPCQKKADKAERMCRNFFHAKIALCRRTRGQSSRKCSRIFRRDMQRCQEIRRNLSEAKSCRIAFRKCMGKCGSVWPCQKNCFANRFTCTNKSRKRLEVCFKIAYLSRNQCEIGNYKRQEKCSRQYETKMYTCLHRASTKRVVCLTGLGSFLRKCTHEARKKRLKCWFKKMDRQYLCAVGIHKTCKQQVKANFTNCLDQCTICKVASR